MFKDKVVVVTGAGSGIGRALAQRFADFGSRLALNDYNADTLAETVKMLSANTRVYYEVFDVSSREKMYAFAANVIDKYGEVDVVINNAGVAVSKKSVMEATDDDYEWILGINLWGVIHGTRAFLPHLRKQDWASVINISSVFGLQGIPMQAPYCTTKFAVRGFTDSLMMEERAAGSNIHVGCVHPGGIQTNIARSARGAEDNPRATKQFEKSFITPPLKAADTIINGIKRRKHRITIGPDGRIIWLLSRYAPWFLRWYIFRMLRQVS